MVRIFYVILKEISDIEKVNYLMEYKVGELVLLPETKYPGVIGSVISENKSGILVRFNGAQQLYFKKADLQKYKK